MLLTNSHFLIVVFEAVDVSKPSTINVCAIVITVVSYRIGVLLINSHLICCLGSSRCLQTFFLLYLAGFIIAKKKVTEHHTPEYLVHLYC